MALKLRKKSKVGVALGGGAVLGAAHIGALKAMDELGIPIHAIAGTSIGSFIASLVAFGKTWRELEKISTGLDWVDISGLSLSRLGLLSNNKLGDLIHQHIGKVSIEESDLPLAVVATDITSGEKVVFTKGSVARAVRASTCIPGIFVPVEVGDRLLVDGGIVENVPVAQVRKLGVDVVIGIDLTKRHDFKKPENIIEILLRSFDFALDAATEVQERQSADVIVKPDLRRFNMVDVKQVSDLRRTGYEETMKVLGELV